MNRWQLVKYLRKRRRTRQYPLSSAKPENTKLPSIINGGNRLLLAEKGEWSNYPTDFTIVWKVNGILCSYNDAYFMPEGTTIDEMSLTITASNDDGATSVTVGATTPPQVSGDNAPPLLGLLIT